MREFRWCDFKWNRRAFPDPEGMIKRLKARGLRISLWINPYISQLSSLFEEGMKNGYLLKKPNGDIWQIDQWQPGMAIVDFTNPAAREWYRAKLSELIDMGVDCFKTDFGERIPTDVVYHSGADPIKMHNYYAYLYNKTVFELLEEKVGKDEAVVFARSATVGCQQFPVHWGGDCDSSFEAMAESLRGGLSLGLSGFGFWSHDIGGFASTPSTELYKRWIAFGLLSSHSRLHGDQSYRVPWLFDEEAVDILRHFAKLKNRLMPYLYGCAAEASQTGCPVMRAMLLEFPNDPTCQYLDRQYMLGPSLLVAPIFSQDGTVSYYLPEGTWTNFFTGEKMDGTKWKQESYGFKDLPLLVRPNSVIAVGSHEDRPDYDYSDDVTLRVYELMDGATLAPKITKPDKSETTFMIRREGLKVFIEGHNQTAKWHVLLVGVHSVGSVEQGNLKHTEQGVLIAPTHPDASLIVTLKA
jgi:alpha-D-xyloside xylohydrolase